MGRLRGNVDHVSRFQGPGLAALDRLATNLAGVGRFGLNDLAARVERPCSGLHDVEIREVVVDLGRPVPFAVDHQCEVATKFTEPLEREMLLVDLRGQALGVGGQVGLGPVGGVLAAEIRRGR